MMFLSPFVTFLHISVCISHLVYVKLVMAETAVQNDTGIWQDAATDTDSGAASCGQEIAG